MSILIDTSSLHSLVRYYLPFDKKEVLAPLFKSKIESSEIVLIDKVYLECKFVGGGVITESLPFLNNKKYHLKTDTILPDTKFFNRLDNDFTNKLKRASLSPQQFEAQKKQFLQSADAKLILAAYHELKKGSYKILTEESRSSNDNKAFLKIPLICDRLDIDVISLPMLFESYEISITFRR